VVWMRSVLFWMPMSILGVQAEIRAWTSKCRWLRMAKRTCNAVAAVVAKRSEKRKNSREIGSDPEKCPSWQRLGSTAAALPIKPSAHQSGGDNAFEGVRLCRADRGAERRRGSGADQNPALLHRAGVELGDDAHAEKRSDDARGQVLHARDRPLPR